MKTSIKSLLLGLTILIFSCSKENETPYDESMVVGNWQLTSIDYSGTSTTSILGIKAVTNFTGKGIDMDFKVGFVDDPNEYISMGDYNIELTTELAGQITTEIYKISDFMMPGTWSLKGDKLIIENLEDTQEAIIKELKSSVMVLVSKYENTTSQTGFTLTQKVTSTFKFERLN